MVMEFSIGSHRHGGLEEQNILEHSLVRLVQIGNIREDPNVLKDKMNIVHFKWPIYDIETCLSLISTLEHDYLPGFCVKVSWFEHGSAPFV